MNLPVVRGLVEKFPLEKIQEAISLFELEKKNVLNVEGGDEGEKLTNLLVAEFVLKKQKHGVSFNEAIREYSQRVRSFIRSKK